MRLRFAGKDSVKKESKKVEEKRWKNIRNLKLFPIL